MTTESTATTTWLSREAHARLKEKLAEMEGPIREDIVNKIEAAREEGDLRENGGYHAAKEEQGKLESRIKVLSALLRSARVGVTPRGDVAEEGCLVTVDFGGGDLETFLFANRENATDDGGKANGHDVYSPESPLGQAIAGRKPGEQVTFGDRNVTVTITEVKPYED